MESDVFTVARNPLLCACGCGRPVPRASKTHLSMGKRKGELQETLTRHRKRRRPKFRFRIDAATGCWLWAGALTVEGYGRLTIHGKHTTAHRALFQYLTGAIPADKHVDHGCRNKACCNPLHMEVVSPGENTRRTKLSHCEHLEVFQPTLEEEQVQCLLLSR